MNKKTALALGNFDGLHLGHMEVIRKLREFGEAYEPCALIFDEHPVNVITGKNPPLLISEEEKRSLLENMGIRPLKVSFSSIRNLTPEEFAGQFLKSLDVGAVSCGSNYTFGRNASGNSALLVDLCKKNGILYIQADDVLYKGSLISSTRIRQALKNGEAEDAINMLGRPYSFTLPVIKGRHLGNSLGFPTLNQEIPDEYIKLRHGVYLTQAEVCGKEYNSITNFGIRPTVDGKELLAETYLFDFDRDIYGQDVKISFLSFLRDEEKFNSLDELKTQIEKDRKQAAVFFGA
ncbi:MAG: bifunctional riboflavin kinase/FAD synthetase [Clostridiales bacterium]|nr:bifunctional riboflavin kinase/FAD synthetase [Clostridiales bacterium]